MPHMSVNFAVFKEGYVSLPDPLTILNPLVQGMLIKETRGVGLGLLLLVLSVQATGCPNTRVFI